MTEPVTFEKTRKILSAIRDGHIPLKLGRVIVAPNLIIGCEIKRGSVNETVVISTVGNKNEFTVSAKKDAIVTGIPYKELVVYSTRSNGAAAVLSAVYAVLEAVQIDDPEAYLTAQSTIDMHVNEVLI
jgi:hypothetical protein